MIKMVFFEIFIPVQEIFLFFYKIRPKIIIFEPFFDIQKPNLLNFYYAQ